MTYQSRKQSGKRLPQRVRKLGTSFRDMSPLRKGLTFSAANRTGSWNFPVDRPWGRMRLAGSDAQCDTMFPTLSSLTTMHISQESKFCSWVRIEILRLSSNRNSAVGFDCQIRNFLAHLLKHDLPVLSTEEASLV
jgi:hypothetical protein